MEIALHLAVAWRLRRVLNATAMVSSSTAATLSAACPAGKHAVTGGCDAGAGGSLVLSSPAPAPADGALGSTVTAWACQYGGTSTHTAYALCCAQ